MASHNLDDFRELSSKADKQLQELEKMLSKHNGDSDELTAGSSKYMDKYNEMLKETTQRPSAKRKFDEQNNFIDTKTFTQSGNEASRASNQSSASKLEEDLKGSHTLKFFQNVQNSFEPIESELQRIREILDKEK